MSNEKIDISKQDKNSLEWIQLMKDIHPNDETNETFFQKTGRKLKENPLVPIGTLATAGCLTYGLMNMVRGDSAKQQRMMRGRVFAQGFTVAAILCSFLLFQSQKTQK